MLYVDSISSVSHSYRKQQDVVRSRSLPWDEVGASETGGKSSVVAFTKTRARSYALSILLE